MTAAPLRAYRDEGYLVLRGLFPAALLDEALAEAEALRRRHDLIHSDNLRCRWQPHVETGACLFECFDPIVDLARACARPARGGRRPARCPSTTAG